VPTSPAFIRNSSRPSTIERWLHECTDLVVTGLARLDRPWQEHARRNAFEAVAALRREHRERLVFPSLPRTAPPSL
jgi:hypothetical protein